MNRKSIRSTRERKLNVHKMFLMGKEKMELILEEN